MDIPISGLILIPLTLAIFGFSSYLAEWAVFSSVIQGAALVNFGGAFTIGLSPYFFVAVLIASRVIPQWVTGRILFCTDEAVTRHLRALALFVLWSVLSALALPVLFDGLPIDSPRAGVDQGYYLQLPLHWSPSNAGQAGYMILNLLVVIYLLQLSTRPGKLERLVNAFSWSGVFVAAVGGYQILCHRLGLPFPTWLFNSNQAWAQAPNQLIGAGFSRMSATFVEPSDAAGFLAAWSVFELSLAITGGRRNGLHWLWAAVGSVMLVETASTTGYVTAAIMWLAMAFDCGSTILRRGWIKLKATLAVVALAAAGFVALISIPSAWSLLDAVVFNKSVSRSAAHRTSTFGRALEVFQHSWGLGAGLGSNRAMSIFFYVLSNLGLPGMLLILVLLTQLYMQIRVGLYTRPYDLTARAYLQAVSTAFVANLVALLASGAEITQPRLWILWGLVVAAIRYGSLMETASDAQSTYADGRTYTMVRRASRSPLTDHVLPTI
jgi:hypothetical protein